MPERNTLLSMWVIYRPTTRDYPGRWVVRKHYAMVGGAEQVDPECTLHGSLAEARAILPAGLYCLGRFDCDDPVIEETWV